MEVDVVIEIPKGSTKKYEMDKVTNKIVVDRELSIPCPQYYGYIKGTLSEDGDPSDIFIITDQELIQGETYKVKVDTVYLCTDGGVEDNKYVGFLGEEPSPWTRDYGINFYLRNYKPAGVFEILDVEVYPNRVVHFLKQAKERYNNFRQFDYLNNKLNTLKSILIQTLSNEDKSKLIHKLYSLD